MENWLTGRAQKAVISSTDSSLRPVAVVFLSGNRSGLVQHPHQ